MEITPTFNAAANPGGEAGAVAESPSPSGPHRPEAAASASQSAPLDITPEQPMTLEAAQSELEALEDGRPDLAPRHNLKPETRLKTIVDSAWERGRESRVRALEAYIDYAHNNVANGPYHDEDLEPYY